MFLVQNEKLTINKIANGKDDLYVLINYLNANGLSSKSCREVIRRIEKEA